MRKFICLGLIVSLLFSLLGCAGVNNTNSTGTHQVDGKIDKRLKSIIDKFEEGGKPLKIPVLNELKESNDEDKAELLMDFADDMAKAQFFGLVNDNIIAMAGKVVKEYPHPLLLNNYGAMLTEVSPEDGLYLLLHALEYEPTNPVILTNIANMYIQLDDFGQAEKYANEALISTPDFGAAYQVLTTCHLKNGNSILASETMVKSAKHCFNELTIYHFENFIDAVDEQLDPKVDEYPLKEEFINDLYIIAKENVDTIDVSSVVDTPEAQLTLNSLPNIGSADDLRHYLEYFDTEHDKTWSSYLHYEDEYLDFKSILDEEEAEEEQRTQDSDGLAFHIEKNLRQRYAFEVLSSFYLYKIEKERLNLEDEFETMRSDMELANDDIIKNYQELQKVDEDHIESLNEDLMRAYESMNMGEIEQITNQLMAEGQGIAIKAAELEVEKEKDILNNELDYVQKMKDKAFSYYINTKQTLEEYWLKSGGLLKYVTNESVFNVLDAQRRVDVNYYVSDALDKIMGCAGTVSGQHGDIAMAETNLYNIKSIIAGNELEREEKEEERQRKGEELNPEMEDGVLSTYPEKNAVGELGLEFDLFGLISANGQTDGTDYSLEVSGSVSILKGTIGGRTITEKGVVSKEAYTTAGVDVDIKPGDLIPEKALGKGAGKLLGSISFGASESISRYNVMSGNKITDFGTIRTSETSMGAGPVGSSKQTTIRRSSITGVAIKNKSIKYKFMFLTYTVPNN